jgi:hypothetical protein
MNVATTDDDRYRDPRAAIVGSGKCLSGEKDKGISPMRRQRGYLYGGLGVAVALLSMVAALEAQVASAPSGVERGSVNRALKGDRLPLIPGATGAVPTELPRAREPKLPDGCDDANAPRGPFSAEVAGRCVAAAPTDRQLVFVG